MVLKYKFNTGTTTDDEVDLYVFTSPNVPATEPSTTYLGPVTGTVSDATNLGRVALRQGTATSSPTLWVDGIRASTNWSLIVTSVKNLSGIASDFNLSQNYPNPFNPVTNINFSIPSTGFVSMKVYNSLGKEVSGLVNQNLSQGAYEVKFNGSNLSSGIYFYTINYTDNEGRHFTDTKKLMLVK